MTRQENNLLSEKISKKQRRRIHLQRKRTVKTSPYKKGCLERAVRVSMPVGDIAYFLEVPYHIVDGFFSVYYQGKKKRASTEKFIKQVGVLKKDQLTYRSASQIYEALDAGFFQKEINESYNEEIVNYAFLKRDEIQRHIVRSLKQLFLDKHIDKPYITFPLTSA